MSYLYPIAGAWLLWVMYLAVMNLKSARDRGALSKPAEYLGMTVLYPGLLLDVLINLVVMTILLLELPKEWTVTARVSRHCHSGKVRVFTSSGTYTPTPGTRSVVVEAVGGGGGGAGGGDGGAHAYGRLASAKFGASQIAAVVSGWRHAVAHWLSGYRYAIAHWMCEHLLNPFDPSGKHCK